MNTCTHRQTKGKVVPHWFWGCDFPVGTTVTQWTARLGKASLRALVLILTFLDAAMKSSSSIALFSSLLGCIFSFLSFLICFLPLSSSPSSPLSSPFFHLPYSLPPGPSLYPPPSLSRSRWLSIPQRSLRLPCASPFISGDLLVHREIQLLQIVILYLSRRPRRRRLLSHVPQKEERLTTSCMSFIPYSVLFFFVPMEILSSESHQLLIANANELFTV